MVVSARLLIAMKPVHMEVVIYTRNKYLVGGENGGVACASNLVMATTI